MSSPLRQRRRCPSCGSSNPADAKSCDMCGYVFGPSDAGSSKPATSFRPVSSAQPVRPQTSPAPLSAGASAKTRAQPPAPSIAPAEPMDAAHVPPVEPASPPSVANETLDESFARMPKTEHAPQRDETQVSDSAHHSEAPDAAGAGATSRAGFRPKPQAAAYQAQPRPAPAPKPAAPYRPKGTASKRPVPISGQRSRSLLSLAIILGTVLGVAALLAVAIAGSGAGRDSSARQVAPPITATQPTTEAPPAAAATEATPTPLPLPSPTEIPAPPPTDTPSPPPTETPAPQPTDTPAAQNNAVTYTVKQGDSCWGIATRFNISVDDLIRQNNLTADCLIRPGQELVITR